jgi:hypothetical protein
MAGDQELTWCRMCGGSGDVRSGDDYETCPICGGSGEHPVDLEYGAVGGDLPPVHYVGDAERAEGPQEGDACVCGHTFISHGTADTHCTMCNVRGMFGCEAFRPAAGPWMTPARARELASAAAELYRQLRAADAARDADPDETRRRAGWRLDVALGGLRSAAEEMLETADELIRLTARGADACPVPWGVCPEHGGTLRATGGRCWCTASGCLRSWGHSRLSEPCTERVTHRVVDAVSGTLDVCDGHAVDVRTRMDGATITPLDPATRGGTW